MASPHARLRHPSRSRPESTTRLEPAERVAGSRRFVHSPGLGDREGVAGYTAIRCRAPRPPELTLFAAVSSGSTAQHCRPFTGALSAIAVKDGWSDGVRTRDLQFMRLASYRCSTDLLVDRGRTCTDDPLGKTPPASRADSAGQVALLFELSPPNSGRGSRTRLYALA